MADKVFPWYHPTAEKPKDDDEEDAKDDEAKAAEGGGHHLRVEELWAGEAVTGGTQFERRLAAPLQGLMNAYRGAFPKYGKEALCPAGRRWPGWTAKRHG